MDGDGPARVPDAVIAELRGRERNGLVELAKPPTAATRRSRPHRGAGPSASTWRCTTAMRPRERVAVLLQLLGGQQRAELPASAIEPLEVAP